MKHQGSIVEIPGGLACARQSVRCRCRPAAKCPHAVRTRYGIALARSAVHLECLPNAMSLFPGLQGDSGRYPTRDIERRLLAAPGACMRVSGLDAAGDGVAMRHQRKKSRNLAIVAGGRQAKRCPDSCFLFRMALCDAGDVACPASLRPSGSAAMRPLFGKLYVYDVERGRTVP